MLRRHNFSECLFKGLRVVRADEPDALDFLNFDWRDSPANTALINDLKKLEETDLSAPAKFAMTVIFGLRNFLREEAEAQPLLRKPFEHWTDEEIITLFRAYK